MISVLSVIFHNIFVVYFAGATTVPWGRWETVLQLP